jgi:hypothetical protein
MRRIRGVALVTYYAKGAVARRETVALDCLLGASRATSAFAVAVTDAQPCKHALKGRSFTIEYDETTRPLEVARSLGAVR